MNKKEIQTRVLQDGKPLALDKFSWDKKTNTFLSIENDLVLDFGNMNYATIKCGDSATINCGHHATIKCLGLECVAIRRDQYEIIELKKDSKYQTCPYNIKGFLKDGIYSETGKPAIIADGILSKIVSSRKTKTATVYKVINHGEKKQTFIIEVDGIYSHGNTLKEAKENFKYKISDRDTSKYDELILDSELTDIEAIKLYRTVTGACESGVRYFVDNLDNKPEKLTVEELIKLTKNQYNNELLVEFFNK